jgi:heptaprenyl diphosphate synthase
VERLSRDEVSLALELVTADLERVERTLLESSSAATLFLTDAATYLSKAGGKRLRPALVELSSHLGSGPDLRVDMTAAALEMTHLATLYHDDVIAEAEARRGEPTANGKWGNTVAILVGDYLFARASSLAADVGGEVPRVLADAIARVVQGQVRELEYGYDARRPTEHYFSTIQDKTASLFEASARLGASVGGCPSQVSELLGLFGFAFGLAFQVADDLLDLAASQDDLGKPPGTDLRVGVYTLPVLLAVECEPTLAQELGTPDPDVDHVRSIIWKTGAFDRAVDVAS